MKLVFDLTPFCEGEDGTVIEFRNIDEYTEFESFFNRQDNVEELYLIHTEDKFLDGRSVCVRIYINRWRNRLDWFLGPSRHSYELGGNRVVNLEDIRIGGDDLGDLSSGEVNLESLFFA